MDARIRLLGLVLILSWTFVVFGFYFSFKFREIWPKVVEVLGGG